MRSLLVALLTLSISITVLADLIHGDLLNDDDPYFVRGADGAVYKVEWYGGSSLFSEGDEVILTTRYGLGKMIADASDETADVWIEEINGSPGLSLESIRKAITRSAIATPPSNPTAPPNLENISSQIANAERQLNSVYSEIRSRLDARQKAELKRDEISWIKQKDSLTGTEKLESITSRISVLQQKYAGPATKAISSSESAPGERHDDLRGSLGAAEARLNKIYSAICARLGAQEKSSLKKDELKWISWKDSLPPNERLKALEARVEALQKRFGQ